MSKLNVTLPLSLVDEMIQEKRQLKQDSTNSAEKLCYASAEEALLELRHKALLFAIEKVKERKE